MKKFARKSTIFEALAIQREHEGKPNLTAEVRRKALERVSKIR
jgi:hypothetical protein